MAFSRADDAFRVQLHCLLNYSRSEYIGATVLIKNILAHRLKMKKSLKQISKV